MACKAYLHFIWRFNAVGYLSLIMNWYSSVIIICIISKNANESFLTFFGVLSNVLFWRSVIRRWRWQWTSADTPQAQPHTLKQTHFWRPINWSACSGRPVASSGLNSESKSSNLSGPCIITMRQCLSAEQISDTCEERRLILSRFIIVPYMSIWVKLCFTLIVKESTSPWQSLHLTLE